MVKFKFQVLFTTNNIKYFGLSELKQLTLQIKEMYLWITNSISEYILKGFCSIMITFLGCQVVVDSLLALVQQNLLKMPYNHVGESSRKNKFINDGNFFTVYQKLELLVYQLLQSWILDTHNTCFLDGSSCTSQVNRHCRYWSDENHHLVKVTHSQTPQTGNVWTGVLGNHIVGTCILPFSEKFWDHRINTCLSQILVCVSNEIPFNEDRFNNIITKTYCANIPFLSNCSSITKCGFPSHSIASECIMNLAYFSLTFSQS